MSIPEPRLKIKSFGVIIIQILCFGLILVIVFILGRISAFSQNQPADPITVIYPPLVTPSKTIYGDPGALSEPSVWAFTGSKTGKTYYPKGCSGVNRIKPENRVYFINQQEAELAGYRRTTTC